MSSRSTTVPAIKAIVAKNDAQKLEFIFQVKNVDGDTRYVIARRSIATDAGELVRLLMEEGVHYADAKSARKEIDELFATLGTLPTTRRLTDRSGWLGDAFILNYEVVGKSDGIKIRHRAYYDPQDDDAPPSEAGTPKAWKSELTPFCSESPLLVFVIALALSGPTLRLAGDGHGVVFDMVGSSGSGKSSIMDAGLSCFQAPTASRASREDSRTTGYLTMAELEERAAAKNDLFMVLDDLAAVEPKSCEDFLTALAYSVREGRGKARSRIGSKGVGHSTLRWTVAALTNREPSNDVQEASARKQGAIARYPQIIVPDRSEGGIFLDASDIEDNARKADQIRNVASKNYGHAGRQLIEYLVANKAEAAPQLERDIRTCVNELNKRFPAHGQQPRFVGSFAKVYAAGRLAINCNIAPFDKGLLDRAVIYVFKQALLALSQKNASYTALLKELAVIGEDDVRAPVLGAKLAANSFAVNAVGFRRHMGGVDTLAIRPDLLQVIADKLGISNGLEALKAAKLIIPDSKRKATQQIQVTGFPGIDVDRPRWVVIDLKKLAKCLAAPPVS